MKRTKFSMRLQLISMQLYIIIENLWALSMWQYFTLPLLYWYQKKLLRDSFNPLLLIFFGKVSNPLLPRRLFQTPDFRYTCLVLFLEPFSKSDADINRDNNKSKKLLEKLKNSGESRKTDFNLVSNEDLKSMEFAWDIPKATLEWFKHSNE